MEKIKSISSLLEPDERWVNHVLLNKVDYTFSPITLDDRYKSITAITLSNNVPETVKSQFNIAIMLGVYAWLYYPLHQMAELKAFSTLDTALRLRFPEVKKGALYKRLMHAVENGIINDAGFSHIIIDPTDQRLYSKKLPSIISSLRNDLAHGSEALHPSSLFTLKNCAEIINQLFLTVRNN